MLSKPQIGKNNKIIAYITYTIILAFVVFNYKTVWEALTYIFSLATPLYIAITIAYLLNMPMKYIEEFYEKYIKKKNLRRGLAVATTLILAFLVIILFISFLIPRVIESISLIISNIYNYSNRLVTLFNETMVSLNINYAINYESIQETLNNLDLTSFIQANNESSGTLDLIVQTFGFFSVFINGITAFIMSIYLLFNKEGHIRQLKKVVTFFIGYKRSQRFFEIGAEANHYFNGFISGQLLECLILGIMMYIGFRIVSLPYSELLASIIAIAALVPMFGCYASFAVGFILVLAVDPMKAAAFAVVFFIIQQIESNIIYPKVVGDAVGLSGLYVLLSLIIFGNLFGFFGLLIAVPLMALIYAIASRVINISLYRNHIEVTDKVIKTFTDEDE
ncbi:MAG: AI-2E family transporter [Erysipelotrichaceae bacterium]|nr:AI-2E family transporter [Erysipelotrichaceae bacterium]